MIITPVVGPMRGRASFAKTDSFLDTVDRTSYTDTGSTLGAVHATREIFVVGGWTNTAEVTSVTIAGVTATVDQTQGSTGGGAFCAHALVPTGTTGDIVVNFSATVEDLAFTVFRVIDRMVVNAARFSSGYTTGTGTSGSRALTGLPNDVFCFGVVGHGNTNATTITDDFTEVDDVATSGRSATASSAIGAGGTRTIGFSWTGSAGWIAALFSYR